MCFFFRLLFRKLRLEFFSYRSVSRFGSLCCVLERACSQDMLLGQNTRVKWRITLDGDTLALGEATTSASGTSAICVSTAGAFALRDPLNAVGASLLRCIVSSLPLRARLVCASVSKGWHAALGGFVALTSLDLSTASFPLQCSASDALRRALPKHGRTLTELRLRGTDKDDALLLAVAQACPRLRLLDLHDRRNIFVAPKNDEEDEESDEEEEEAGFMAAVSVLYAASRPEDTLTLLLEGSGLFHCGRHGGSARCNHLIHTTINTLRARASMRVTPLAATPWLRLDVACCSAAIDAVFMGGHAETPFFRGISRCCGCGFARCFACEPDALGQTGERRPMGCASCAACRQAEKEDGGSSESERGAMKAHDAEKACEEMVAAADRAAPAAAEAQADADALGAFALVRIDHIDEDPVRSRFPIPPPSTACARACAGNTSAESARRPAAAVGRRISLPHVAVPNTRPARGGVLLLEPVQVSERPGGRSVAVCCERRGRGGGARAGKRFVGRRLVRGAGGGVRGVRARWRRLSAPVRLRHRGLRLATTTLCSVRSRLVTYTTGPESSRTNENANQVPAPCLDS